jgi:hypothetical protein
MDDMAKIKVGAPAVSRYHQICRIFSSSDMPNLSDHDFPVPNYLLSVSGYMFLKSKNSSINDDIPTTNNDVDGVFLKLLKACLNGSNIVGPTSSNNVTIIDMTASLSNLFG